MFPPSFLLRTRPPWASAILNRSSIALPRSGQPCLEVVLGWLNRRLIKSPTKEAVITWGSGQFHRHEDKPVAMIDVELGHIGDPMMDFASTALTKPTPTPDVMTNTQSTSGPLGSAMAHRHPIQRFDA